MNDIYPVKKISSNYFQLKQNKNNTKGPFLSTFCETGSYAGSNRT